jgi:hypothetical protein
LYLEKTRVFKFSFGAFLCRHYLLLVVTKYVVQYTYEDNEADNSLTIDGEPEPETVPEQQTDVPTEAENNTEDDEANNDEDPHHHLPIGLALLTLLGKDKLHHVPLYAEILCSAHFHATFRHATIAKSTITYLHCIYVYFLLVKLRKQKLAPAILN